MVKTGPCSLLVIAAILLVTGQVAAVSDSSHKKAAISAAPQQLARYVVSFDEHHKQELRNQLRERGYKVIKEGPGFFTVTHPTSPASNEDGSKGSSSQLEDSRASSSSTSSSSTSSSSNKVHKRVLLEAAQQHHVSQLGALPGVQSSEQDVRRHLHIRAPTALEGSTHHSHSRSLAAAATQSSSAAADTTEALMRLLGHWHMNQRPKPKAYEQWGSDVVDAVCAAKDIQPTPDVPNSEVIPWGIQEIGALKPELQKLQPNGRAIVCIIDSGLWGGHPEYSRTQGPRNTFSGCSTSGSCPYVWNSDLVGHGTHVAGTISATQNGVGVVGVMSQGAEVHIVRVWNDSGDVSQGQGPYATDLVLAYNNCLSYLKAEQAKDSSKKVNMVINMSFGSAGPLTVERSWIEKAAQRGDILFVGSAGNNGSWLDVGKRAAGPASLSGKEPVGQYLSYPASYKLNEMLSVANARCDGSIEFTSQKNKQVSISAPGMAILSSVPREFGAIRGHLVTTAQITAGGRGRGVGYLANGFMEPRPIQGTGIKSTGSLPIIGCSIKDDHRMRLFVKKQDVGCPAAKGAICLSELPGRNGLFEETCAAMLKCVRNGGAGLVVWSPDKSGDADAFYALPGTQLDCGPKCQCWAELKAALGCINMAECSSKAPPGIIISPKHATALLLSGVGKGDVHGTVTNYEYDYKYFDGTSMAAPHVSGAAALIWRQFPDCKAADIAQALKMSAQRLPGQQQVPDYAAGYGMLKVDKAYEWIQKNNKCAQ